MRLLSRLLLILGAAAASAALGLEPSLQSGTVLQAAERLEPGEYLWAPEVAPEGPVLLIVNLATQRAVLYRNGLPIGITTVSTGRPGFRTPTGVFTILQKRVEHYSSTYDNAPMPYMQRLTWRGVALHAGNLPGYPASHGCIRLPHDFARLLFGATHVGMTVIVTDGPAVPHVAPRRAWLARRQAPPADESWAPELSPTGPVSVVVSASDRRVLVIRNGDIIGSAPVEIEGPVERTTAYVLRHRAPAGREWLRILLPGQSADSGERLRGRIRVPEGFYRRVEAILHPGATVVVTSDSLQLPAAGEAETVIDAEGPGR